MKYIRFYFFCVFFICCEKKDNQYLVKGTVQSIEHELNKIIIAHDTIPGLMMPMVMPFSVRDKEEIDNLQIGDSVHFQLIWNDIKPYATKFKVVSQGKILITDDFFDDEYSVKEVGQIIDDVTLLNLYGKDVRLSNSDGRYRFISYIFSRCPMPNMCPAIVMKNRYLATAFSEIEFIMVSFDYLYDTPRVLKQAFGHINDDFDNWQILSSTDHIDDIYKLVRQSGGNFWGVDQGKIGHTLSSVFIGPKREVLRIWKGEEWDVNQVKNALRLYVQ